MTQATPETDTTDCLFNTILGFLLPFFFIGAAGNMKTARKTVIDLINAYNASTPTELDLVGRIIGFNVAAMDNLRLSMDPDLSDTKILRYRSNAVTLTKAADQARGILEDMQANRPPLQKIPRPTVAPAPQAKPPAKPSAAAPQTNASISEVPPLDIEAMKRDARIMMNAFSRQGDAAMPSILDPNTVINAAVSAAMSNASTSLSPYKNPMLNQGTAATTINPASTASR